MGYCHFGLANFARTQRECLKATVALTQLPCPQTALLCVSAAKPVGIARLLRVSFITTIMFSAPYLFLSSSEV